MGRAFVILAAIVGAALALAIFVPPLRTVAFEVGKVGVTWVMLCAAGTGVLAYKVTK